jgi:hypothetical protein
MFSFLKSKIQKHFMQDNMYSLEKIDIEYPNSKLDQKYQSTIYLKKNGAIIPVKIKEDNLENLINKTMNFIQNKI